MIVSRRLFLAGTASLPFVAAIESVPAAALVMPAGPGVGEVWGLRFYSQGTSPAAPTGRRARSPVPAWHPEFC